MDFRILTEFNNIDKLMKRVGAIDRKVYPSKLCGTPENETKRFMKNPNSFIMLMDKDITAGYLCYYSISDRLAQSVREDEKIHDDDISPDDIVPYEKGGKHNIYILSMAVDPAYHGTNAMKIIACELRGRLAKLTEEGCMIKNIQATAVSDAGRRTLARFGLKPLKDIEGGYTVYEGNYENFINSQGNQNKA